MSEPVVRYPNGDRKYPSHFELEKLGWLRGDPAHKRCQFCGESCEWWGRQGRVGWKLFNLRTTQKHSETCKHTP